MIKDLRHSKIMKHLDLHHKAKIGELAKLLDVSEETIRKDLIELEKRDLIERTRGGAVVKDYRFMGISNSQKKNMLKDEKSFMAKIGSRLVSSKMRVFLDNSTSCVELARELLRKRKYISIITNSLEIANLVALSNNIELFLLAGKYTRHSNSFLGPMTLENINSFKADISFVSFATISPSMGFGDNNFDNLYLRKHMIKSSKKAFAIMDHTKFCDDSAKVFTKIQGIDGLITDKDTSDEKLKFLKNIEVLKEIR